MSTQTGEPRAYDVVKNGDVMTVIIRKEFDFGNLHQDWAHLLTVGNPGPFREIRIDLTAVGLVSSTFFAGLIQIHHVYGQTGTKLVSLIKPDPRMVRNLAMLRLDKLFAIEAR